MSRPARRITSADVAREASVSPTTVSLVLNNKPGQSIPEGTRRRVLEAARRLDYRPHAPARALAAGRSDIVLLALPDLPAGDGISRFAEELAAALAAHGLTLVTHLAGAHGRPLADVCAAVGASAVTGLTSFDDGTVAALYRAGADVVLPAGVDDLMAAMQPVGRLQAGHLIGLGHTRIGYAMPAQPELRQQMASFRLQAVADACREAGLDPPVVLTTDLEAGTAASAVTRWAAQSVTGVCAFNDETAIAVLAGIRSAGLAAPADLAVIGADDIPTARLAAPALTTIRFDLREAGRRRAEAVVAGLSGREPAPAPAASSPQLMQVIQRAST